MPDNDEPFEAEDQDAQRPQDSPVKEDIGKFRWLKDAARDAFETEINLSQYATSEIPGFDPFEFQLANGNDVKVIFDLFWQRPSPTDQPGEKPIKDYFIRVYSNEDCMSRRLEFQWEFRARTEFSLQVVTKIGDWLRTLIESREVFKYDALAEFIEDFDIAIADLSAADEDAVEHIAHLPELTIPEAFDHDVDDSIYNDQNEPGEPERR